MPAASLIIPSRGRPQLLLETVESILAGEQVPNELMVMDQSDVPHPVLSTLTTDRPCQLRYLRCEPWGVSYARNQGIRLAKHALLVFTDDDVLVEPGWFGALVSALVAGGLHTVVTGQVRPAEAEVPGGFVPSTRVDADRHVYMQPTDEDVLYSNNMALYRAAIDQVGPFDERLGPGTRFGTAEDSDLGYRLLQAGFCIQYVPEAGLYHRSWRSARDFVPLRWNYGFGRGAFYAKYFSLRNGYALRRMARDVFAHGRSAFSLWRANRQKALGDVALAAGILLGAPGWLIAANRSNPKALAASARQADTPAPQGQWPQRD